MKVPIISQSQHSKFGFFYLPFGSIKFNMLKSNPVISYPSPPPTLELSAKASQKTRLPSFYLFSLMFIYFVLVILLH